MWRNPLIIASYEERHFLQNKTALNVLVYNIHLHGRSSRISVPLAVCAHWSIKYIIFTWAWRTCLNIDTLKQVHCINFYYNYTVWLYCCMPLWWPPDTNSKAPFESAMLFRVVDITRIAFWGTDLYLYRAHLLHLCHLGPLYYKLCTNHTCFLSHYFYQFIFIIKTLGISEKCVPELQMSQDLVVKIFVFIEYFLITVCWHQPEKK